MLGQLKEIGVRVTTRKFSLLSDFLLSTDEAACDYPDRQADIHALA